jgi:hypothetical protein
MHGFLWMQIDLLESVSFNGFALLSLGFLISNADATKISGSQSGAH